jgi:hypothetical protein
VTTPPPAGPNSHEPWVQRPVPPPTPADPRWAPPAVRRRGLSAGGVVGVVAATVAVVAVVWGIPVSALLASGALTAEPTVATDPGAEPTAPPTPTLFGDLALDRDATTGAEPQLAAMLPDNWEEADVDDDPFHQFYDDDTECYLTVDTGEHTGVDADATDSRATDDLIDGYIDGMKEDHEQFSSVSASSARSSVWADANDGAGRVELQQARVDYTLADGGDQWQSLVVGRVFTSPSSLVLAYLDCPVSTEPDDANRAADQAFVSLEIRG